MRLDRISSLGGKEVALEGLKRVLKRIEEIRRGFSELSLRGDIGESPVSFKELYLKKVGEKNPEEAVRSERSLPETVESRLPPSPKPSQSKPLIKEVVERASKIYGIDEDLIMAIIEVESGFNPRTVSQRGAMGLMQLMPGTARELGVLNPFDIEENIMGGVKYLKYLSEKYKGNLELILAAYNAGPSIVDRYGEVPPYPETQDYVRKVLSIYDKRRGGR